MNSLRSIGYSFKTALADIIDNSILGGLKVQVEDYILDDSIKNHLLKLKETITLKKGESN
mgnify:CR=1 FL=1